ncbi:hypothetical protein HYU91_01700 [Candidatus Collierbacteria bacterium]|nr:hypothetical protein [Candidatus Collierbacteria bacterium]
MKEEIWDDGDRLTKTRGRAVEVVTGLKSLTVVMALDCDGREVLGLYRPESGIRLSVDPRIPKPSELYRDVEYSRMCREIGWEIAAPVFSWRLSEEDRGVIRPYWRQVTKIEVYNFRRDLLLNNDSYYWLRIAMADYVFGVGDRVSNDFLVTDDGLMVVDSGFSYLPGLEFVGQQSIVRETLRGESIPEQLMNELRLFSEKTYRGRYLSDEEVYWVGQRIQRVLDLKKII